MPSAFSASARPSNYANPVGDAAEDTRDARGSSLYHALSGLNLSQGPPLPQSGFPTQPGGCAGHRSGGCVRCPRTQEWCLQGSGEAYRSPQSSPGAQVLMSLQLQAATGTAV